MKSELLKKLPKVKCLNEEQKELIKGIKEFDITFCSGATGSGKTYVTLLEALHQVKTSSEIEKIVLVKSVTVVKGEEIGFLKGDQDSKMEPFMYSYTGNINKIFRNDDASNILKEEGIIQWLPIAYVRGVNIDNSIIIVDEAQNLSVDNFKTIITRMGNSSKIIFLGDTEQIDRKIKNESCLHQIVDMFKDSDSVKIVELPECVRNPIIPKVLEVLKNNGY